MNKLILASCLASCLAGLGLGSRALAASSDDEKLLVVVEESPGGDVAAADVRRAISAELGTPVLAPADDDAGESVKVLIVALERGRVRMAMHASAAGISSRTIPAPDDRQARLRAIGWLAGNLARDQVSRIVAMPSAAEPASPVESSLVADAAAEARPATEPPPQPGPASPPPPAAVVAVPAATGTAAESGRWSVTLAGGPAVMAYGLGSPSPSGFLYSASYQVEVERVPATGGLILGAALDVGSNSAGSFLSRQLGGAAFFASSWHRKRSFLELTAGLGLEVLTLPVTSETFTQSSTGGPTSTTTVGTALVPVLYARGVGTIGFPITSSLDLLARFGTYLQSAGFDKTYVTATVGARFTLP